MSHRSPSYNRQEMAEAAVTACLDEGLLSEREAKTVRTLLEEGEPMKALEQVVK